MTSVVILAGFLLNAGCTIGKEPKHPNWKNATGAEQYERLMWQAIRDKKWQDLESHVASTFAGVNTRGQSLDRSGWVDYWKSAPVHDFNLAEVTTQPNGPDITVTYVLHLDSGPALRVISVWQQIKGGWMLIATSITPAQA